MAAASPQPDPHRPAVSVAARCPTRCGRRTVRARLDGGTIALMGACCSVGHGFAEAWSRAPATAPAWNLLVPVPAGPRAARTAAEQAGSSKERRPGPNSSIASEPCVAAADRRQCGPRSDQPRRCPFWWPRRRALLAAGLAWRQEWILAPLFTVAPPACCCCAYLAVVLNGRGSLPLLERGKAAAGWHGSDLVVGGLSWRLAGYLAGKGSRAWRAEPELSWLKLRLIGPLSHRPVSLSSNQRRQCRVGFRLPLEPTIQTAVRAG